ncbi:MAG: hypothetical protein K1X72_24225 [Pyrinomonadaceae bacterium]|nr:hypothetical protein [Pyrinomonadaceae bacterium]
MEQIADYAGVGNLHRTLKKLTATPKPPTILYASWFLFLASIIAASIVLLIVSICVRRFALEGKTDILLLKIFLFLEYLFFLLGLLALAIRIAQLWLITE